MLKLAPLLLGITLFIANVCASAQVAGLVLFKSGDASITRADHSMAQLVKNDPIHSGDTIETRQGRVQISYVDGGKVSLQPHTIYKISQYVFSGAEDGSEYAITELIKGGLRTMTGLIGHKNRERYQLRTPVATIGIRGTEYTALFETKLNLTTQAGVVEVCNQAGCRSVTSGQSITVSDQNSMPQYSAEAAKLAVSMPSTIKPVFVQAKPVFVQAENLSDNRLSAVVMDSVMRAGIPLAGVNDEPADSIADDPTNTVNGTDILINAVAKTANTFYHFAIIDGTADNNSNNNLARFESGNTDIKLVSANRGDFFSDAFVTMGRGKGSINNINLETLTYITGEATSAASLLQLANLNSNLQYNVIASTAPVLSSNGNTIAVGNANAVSGNLLVNFASLLYSYSLNVPLGNLLYNLAGSDTLTAGTADFASNATITTNLGNIGCLSGCTGVLTNQDGTVTSIVGRFIGENAERLGLQYGLRTSTSSNNKTNSETLTGSVILQK